MQFVPKPTPVSEARTVPYRLYADEACTQEILPDANGDYWLPSGEAVAAPAGEPTQKEPRSTQP